MSSQCALSVSLILLSVQAWAWISDSVALWPPLWRRWGVPEKEEASKAACGMVIGRLRIWWHRADQVANVPIQNPDSIKTTFSTAIKTAKNPWNLAFLVAIAIPIKANPAK